VAWDAVCCDADEIGVFESYVGAAAVTWSAVVRGRVTLVGHSAGGQFIHRYAACGRAPETLPGMPVSYVTANPSSYLYLSSHRPVEKSQLRLCPQYNDYKYGLDNRSGYLSAFSDEQIRRQYASHRVTYLLGGADVHQDKDLENNCAARAQGANRFQRGCFYHSFIKTFLPSARHDLVVVAGVGHDHDAMFNSVPGKTAIFTPAYLSDTTQEALPTVMDSRRAR